MQHMLKASLLIVPSHTVKQFKSEARACLRLSLGTDILVYESGEEFNTEMADTEDDMKKIMAAKVNQPTISKNALWLCCVVYFL